MSPLDPRLNVFISRCEKLALKLKISRSTLSTKLFADGKRLHAIASGLSDVGIGRLARAEQELAALERVAAHRDSSAAA